MATEAQEIMLAKIGVAGVLGTILFLWGTRDNKNPFNVWKKEV